MADAFNPLSLLSGLIGGGMKMFANKQENDMNWENNIFSSLVGRENQEDAQNFNATESALSREYGWGQFNEAKRNNNEQADIQRAWSAGQQQKAEEFNAREAGYNRDFQTYMSGTAYQRAMADMKAAGLNPLLAYQQGGAGIGSGAQASIGPAGGASSTVGGTGGGQASSSAAAAAAPARMSGLLQGAVTSASEAARLKPQIDLIDEQADVARHTKPVLTQEADVKKATVKNIEEQTRTQAQQTNLVEQQVKNEPQRFTNMTNLPAVGTWLGNLFRSNSTGTPQQSSAKGIAANEDGGVQHNPVIRPRTNPWNVGADQQ